MEMLLLRCRRRLWCKLRYLCHQPNLSSHPISQRRQRLIQTPLSIHLLNIGADIKPYLMLQTPVLMQPPRELWKVVFVGTHANVPWIFIQKSLARKRHDCCQRTGLLRHNNNCMRILTSVQTTTSVGRMHSQIVELWRSNGSCINIRLHFLRKMRQISFPSMNLLHTLHFVNPLSHCCPIHTPRYDHLISHRPFPFLHSQLLFLPLHSHPTHPFWNSNRYFRNFARIEPCTKNITTR